MIRNERTEDLDLDDLREAVRDVLGREAGLERTRHAMEQSTRHDAKLWELIASLGWTGLAIPEEYGGSGATLSELGVVLQELGRALVPCAFVPSVVLFGGAILLGGRPEKKSEILPRVASGELLASAALVGFEGHCEAERLGLEVRERGVEIVVRGIAEYVQDADVADLILVAGRTPEGRTALLVIDTSLESVEITPQPLFDPTRSFSRLELHDVVVPREAMIGDAAGGEELRQRLIDLAAIAIACDCAGGAGAVLEATLEYTKERHQFGRPVASFQALKHRCVDMMMCVEGSTAVAGRALDAFSTELSETRIAASEAKTFGAEAYGHVAREGVQMHGGVGFTWEYDCHLYLKRAVLNQALLGDSRWHRDRAAEALLGAPGRA